MAKKPTLRDVSRASGLSVYTVSRALSNAEGVSARSRELVLKATRELGYVPNRAAQELRRNTRSSVAVITASTSNYYYIDLMKGIERTLRLTDRTAVVADIAAEGVHTAAREDTTVRNLIQSRTAGVISTLTLSQENTRLLADWDVPVVFVDSYPPENTDLPSITMDNFSASIRVGAHLADHGYTDWLFLVYPALWSTRLARERGIRAVARRHGAKLTVLESQNDAASACATLTGYLDRPGTPVPRAIIAGNNPMVHATLQVLHDRGLSVPEDVAIIGYDDFAWAPFLDPPLTVLDEDSEHIGVLAAQTLARIIDEQLEAERGDGSSAPVYRQDDSQEVSSELVIRRSCGC